MGQVVPQVHRLRVTKVVEEDKVLLTQDLKVLRDLLIRVHKDLEVLRVH